MKRQDRWRRRSMLSGIGAAVAAFAPRPRDGSGADGGGNAQDRSSHSPCAGRLDGHPCPGSIAR